MFFFLFKFARKKKRCPCSPFDPCCHFSHFLGGNPQESDTREDIDEEEGHGCNLFVFCAKKIAFLNSSKGFGSIMSESLNPALQDMIPSDGLTDSGPAGANSWDNSMGQSEMSLYHSAQFSFERTTNTLLKPSCGPLIIPMQAVCMHYPSSPFGQLELC